MQYTYQDVFSTAQNSFWTCWFWCLLVLLLFFVSPLPYQQNSFLWGLFSSMATKNKVTWGEIGWIGRVRHGGHAIFGQKVVSSQCGMGRCVHKSPIVKWSNVLRESSKNFHWSQMQPLTTTPAGTLIQLSGFLEHSPSRGSLYYMGPTFQKIILVLGGHFVYSVSSWLWQFPRLSLVWWPW